MPAQVLFLASFTMISLASRQIGTFLTRWRLPLISGYLIAGIVAGPFISKMFPLEASEDLRFINQISLAFIAFAAGNELYLREIRGRVHSIVWNVVGQLVAVYVAGIVGVLLLADFMPFMQDLGFSSRFAVAILIGSILVARSPSSVIAVVDELRAKGPFTKTAVGVTVTLDVGVVVLFAISASVADVLLTGHTFDLSLVLLLFFEVLLAVGLGYAVGRLLGFILARHLDQRLKMGYILLLGYGIFVLSERVRDISHDNLPFEVLLEPLLIAMIGSFVVTNYSAYRDEFRKILQDAGPGVYVAFFTLIGLALRVDILVETFVLTLAVFGVRVVGLLLGSLGGGTLAGDPLRQRRLLWLAFVTQAGVGLGLAQEAAAEFPQLGDQFTTLIVSAIVLSQIVGPPLLKFIIKYVGEAHLPEQATPDEVRDALILGMDSQSLALARLLKAQNWQVIMADTDQSRVEQLEAEDLDERYIPEVSVETLSSLVTGATDALVAMLDDDDMNYRACEIAYERFGIPRLIARLNRTANAHRFEQLGVLAVDSVSAMVHLLDQLVRAPQSVAILLHRDPEHEIVQATVRDYDYHGLALRDLRLPTDVLVLGITRDGHSIVPHGYTTLRVNDEITLLGHPDSLEVVTRRLGF